MDTILLGFIGMLVAGSTAFFSTWAGLKIGPVEVSQVGVETPYGQTKYANIRKISLEKDQPATFFPSTTNEEGVTFLLIEELSGKTHVLSSENYPVQEVLTAIKEQMEKLKDRKN